MANFVVITTKLLLSLSHGVVNIYHIIILLELLNELLNSLASLSIELLSVSWDANTLTRDNLVTLVIKPLLDCTE